MTRRFRTLFFGTCLAATTVRVGGSNYGIEPGALAEVRGVVLEGSGSVPAPQLARDPAPGRGPAGTSSSQ